MPSNFEAAANLAVGVGGLVGNSQAASNAKDQAEFARLLAHQTTTSYEAEMVSTRSNISSIQASAGTGINTQPPQARFPFGSVKSLSDLK